MLFVSYYLKNEGLAATIYYGLNRSQIDELGNWCLKG